MGGGYVSKQKLVSDEEDKKGQLLHYFHIKEFPLCAGTAPIYHSVLDQLKNDNVGLIVTLLLEPLHSGRLINHVPFDHDETEWTDGDEGIEDYVKELDIELLHVPVNDACPPTNDSVNKLLEGIKEFITRRPNEKIYFHCWKGSGRTSVMLILALHSIWDVSLKKAINMVQTANTKYRITYEYQSPYLDDQKNPDFPYLSASLYKDIYDPTIRTPSNHKCWELQKPANSDNTTDADA
jgi:hypothetical protein